MSDETSAADTGPDVEDPGVGDLDVGDLDTGDLDTGDLDDVEDLDVETVRLLLLQQGYRIPERDLLEVTASLNALIEGLTALGPLDAVQDEPWPVLVGYLEDRVAS